MKCPSCGMNIRDDTLVCGYCGEKIPQQPSTQPDSMGKRPPSSGPAAQKGAVPKKPLSEEDEMGEEDEEGGLSPYLQPGEQVLIGSLNVSVKKFFFHAYLTDRRIFLIDTQEKKLKVTAKDVPRNTLAASTVEFSENSDPVLVLSIRSADDEIKTMKIVFVQNGMDRSAEIDEWTALLHKEDEPPARKKRPAAKIPAEAEVEEAVGRKKRLAAEAAAEDEVEEAVGRKKRPAAEAAAEAEPEKIPVLPRAPAKDHELKPVKKPVRDLEKQPPVKRLVSFTKAHGEEPPREVQPVSPPRRTHVRQVPEPGKKVPDPADTERKDVTAPRDHVSPVKKPEVQSAMKVAMKSAMKPLAQPQVRPFRRDSSERGVRRPVIEPTPGETAEPPHQQKIPDKVYETPVHEESAEVPQFCHNCGKKLPLEANFCPGCGTRMSPNRTLTNARFPQTRPEKRPVPADTLIPDRKQVSPHRTEVPDEDEIEDEKPQPTKPPIKKAPRGSEMTILHKFLRR